MPDFDVPDERATRIMSENGLKPERFCVILQNDTTIVLRNYKTRDDVIIRKGDRPW